jgi:hypothetical protein
MRLHKSNDWTSRCLAAFEGATSVVEICYECDHFPNFRLTVLVRTRRVEGAAPDPYAVPLWFVIPDSSPARAYTQWDFADERALRKVLDRLWFEVIEPYAIPLAEDRAALENARERFVESVVRRSQDS